MAPFQAKSGDLESVSAIHCPVPHENTHWFISAAVDFHFTHLFINSVGMRMFLFLDEMSLESVHHNAKESFLLLQYIFYIPVLLE